MLCNVSFSSIWRALFVAPLFLTVLFIWMTPIYPAVVLTGRVGNQHRAAHQLSEPSVLVLLLRLPDHPQDDEAAELQAQNQLLGMENAALPRTAREHMDTTRQPATISASICT